MELEANLEERIRRNETENRLNNKPTKRNIEWSKKDLIKGAKEYRLNSLPGEVKEKNYLRINNSNISAKEVAKIIKEKFARRKRRAPEDGKIIARKRRVR